MPLRSIGSGLVLAAVPAALVIFFVAICASGLDVPFDYDGYDEGVYWQTLRAMHAGFRLYRAIFFSQPPGLMEAVYPFYETLGGGIFAARLGVAAIALVGLAGAYALGRTLSGRMGGLIATALTATMPMYVAQARTLQAEGPATAMMLVTVAAAMAWHNSRTRRGLYASAAVCGAGLMLGLDFKLLNVTAVVPVLIVAARRLGHAPRAASSLVVMAGAAVATAILCLLPVVEALPALHAQAWSFHIVAREVVPTSAGANLEQLSGFLAANAVLCAASLAGGIIAARDRDWRLVPLAAWLAATLALLALHRPLFFHHTLVLLPPLVALAVFGTRCDRTRRRRAVSILQAALCLVAAGMGGWTTFTQLPTLWRHPDQTTSLVADLRQFTAPRDWIVTDGQFAISLANRDAPPAVVDTSRVRIESGFLDDSQLIAAASLPRTRAVLFATGRFMLPQLAGFRRFVRSHYHRARSYGDRIELWVRGSG